MASAFASISFCWIEHVDLPIFVCMPLFQLYNACLSEFADRTHLDVAVVSCRPRWFFSRVSCLPRDTRTVSSHWTWRLVPQHEGSSSTPLSSEVLEAALDAVLGCGAEVSVDYLKCFEHDLLHTLQSLPKVDSRRIESFKLEGARLRALEPQERVAFGRGFVSVDQSFTLEDAASFTAARDG